jgi:murein L,D-transpeptidase YafK
LHAECTVRLLCVVKVLRPMSPNSPSRPLSRRTLIKGVMLASAAPLIAACQSEYGPKHLQPLSAAMKLKLERLAMSESDPVFMRIFKEEGEFEVWKQGPGGRYLLLETYDICTWSGELGPKFQEGDRQAPEGFYTITPAQMNPNSSYYLSFNLGFPNAYDRSHGRTGSHLMVHGACSSAGCYAMTDEQIAEIYALAREAFEGGQRAFQVHAFPFRMTPENMARHANHEHFAFWEMLQEGYQHFELTRIPPQVDVCDRRYIFNAVAAEQFSAAEQCPDYTVPEPIASSFEAAQAEYREAFEVALAEYNPPAGVTLQRLATRPLRPIR